MDTFCTCTHWGSRHTDGTGACQDLDSYDLPCSCPSLEPDPFPSLEPDPFDFEQGKEPDGWVAVQRLTRDMDKICDQFRSGRREMIEAFVQVSDLARRAGVDEDTITRLHGRFFDGNVEVKDAFAVAEFWAWLPRRD